MPRARAIGFVFLCVVLLAACATTASAPSSRESFIRTIKAANEAAMGGRLTAAEYLPGYFDLVFRPALYGAFWLLERRVLPAAWKLRATF